MDQSWSDPVRVLDVVERVLSAPMPEILRRFSLEVAELVPHRAAAMQTGDCARFPVKVAGDGTITEAITSAELQRLAADAEDGTPAIRRGTVGGRDRPLVTATASPAVGKGALLVLVLPEGAVPSPSELAVVGRLWSLLSVDAAQRATDPAPDLLGGSLAAATARAHAITDLSQTHAATLNAVLSVLRSRKLADRTARETATELATSALLDLRAVADRDRALSIEDAVAAFAVLTAQLEPLVRHLDVTVDLVGPEEDRQLAQDIAHIARTVTRGLVLNALEGGTPTRVRASWHFDGGALRVVVRDDCREAGDAVVVPGLAERIAPLGGRFEVDAVPGWGRTVTAVLPLGTAEKPPEIRPLDRLNARETEVLTGIFRGLRNRQIAEELSLSEHTVKFHVRNLLEKLGVRSRGEAAALARELGVAPPAPVRTA